MVVVDRKGSVPILGTPIKDLIERGVNPVPRAIQRPRRLKAISEVQFGRRQNATVVLVTEMPVQLGGQDQPALQPGITAPPPPRRSR